MLVSSHTKRFLIKSDLSDMKNVSVEALPNSDVCPLSWTPMDANLFKGMNGSINHRGASARVGVYQSVIDGATILHSIA